MNAYQTNLFINTQAHPPPEYGPAQKALLNQDAFADVEAEITKPARLSTDTADCIERSYYGKRCQGPVVQTRRISI